MRAIHLVHFLPLPPTPCTNLYRKSDPFNIERTHWLDNPTFGSVTRKHLLSNPKVMVSNPAFGTLRKVSENQIIESTHVM